ncbi:MAG: YggS family pyridoxal phosphate-dependent enzyme [Gammaproteobacteria bacterium]|nr:MAG: YggS family pyridoxal phosphate-dependent enzyme [Gammaproteobacteria bacterium]
MSLELRYQAVVERIKKAPRPTKFNTNRVRLIAVSKTRSADDIRSIHELGQTAFGENYVQEALDKIRQLRSLPLEWHFIGSIQSNKTREIAAHFDWVHSIDRLKIARRLNDQRPAQREPLDVCLEVNISEQAGKSGVLLQQLPQLAEQVDQLPRLRLRGLMAIPQKATEFDEQRAIFRRMREALLDLNRQGLDLDTLSMGMSGDMEAAIAEGATMVRIGTDIFGPRTYP